MTQEQTTQAVAETAQRRPHYHLRTNGVLSVPNVHRPVLSKFIDSTHDLITVTCPKWNSACFTYYLPGNEFTDNPAHAASHAIHTMSIVTCREDHQRRDDG